MLIVKWLVLQTDYHCKFELALQSWLDLPDSPRRTGMLSINLSLVSMCEYINLLDYSVWQLIRQLNVQVQLGIAIQALMKKKH